MVDRICNFVIDWFDWIMNTIIVMLLILIVLLLHDLDINQTVYEIKVFYHQLEQFNLEEIIDVARKTGI